MKQQKFLTKSRYINGLQCSKWIWLAFNKPEELPETDQTTQHRFDEGHRVEELAKSLFPDGINIEEVIPIENDKKSRELLKKRKPLFEAGFIHKNGKCYARADILLPVGKNEWDVLEVKSATTVKEDYFEDLSFQKYCYKSVGLKIRNCFVLHVNNQYVRQGEVDPKEFFTIADITQYIKDLMPEVPTKIRKLFDITKLKKCPEFKRGEEYHNDSFGIHKDDKFWQEHPECDILDLYYGGKKAIELFNSGILSIKDLNDNHLTRKQQMIQHKVAKTKQQHHDKEELLSFIKTLKYPLYFLDFESYYVAIPLYDGLKPYQQIPFQFSLHVIKKEGQKPKHHSFIAEGSEDPRLRFIEELNKVLGTNGSVIVYNQSFEQTVLKNLALYFPKYQEWVKSIIERMADLYSPFRNFAYYHPNQKGSTSLKYVLPVLTGVTYEDLEIANSSNAYLSYIFITHGNYEGEKATPEEIKKVRADLEKYCGRDTEGMIWIFEKLKKLID